MLRILYRLFRWLVRAEEAHALYTWVLPLIPAGVGGSLAALAAQQGWVVWLVSIASYALFAAGRYYVARYVVEHGLKGKLSISCAGLRTFDTNNDNTISKKTLHYIVTNHAEFPVTMQLKSKFTHDGRVFEEDDYDPPTVVGPNSSKGVFSGPIINVNPTVDQYNGTVHVMYGRDERHMDTTLLFSVKDNVDGGFSILKMEYGNRQI